MEDNMSDNIKIEPVAEPKKEIEVKTVASNKEKRNGNGEKSRKKDDKSIEQILKSLGVESPEEKLSVMCKKYIEILDENRKLQMTLKQTEKKALMVQREKEQMQSEKSKAVLTRSRLESLCRELQRQNKAVKEESLLKIREEEEKRKEVSAKFQSTLTDITALMAETNEKNVKLHEDNIEIHKKFKTVFDEMDIREQHFEGMHQMMKHELQVAEAKLAKVTLEMTEEKENLLKDKSQLLLKLTEYQTRIRELQAVEAGLRSQVKMYTDKYDEFQSALSKSNEVFGGFNEEMEKMSKKIIKLEKETSVWKSKWHKSHSALLEMAADKQTRDTEIATLNRKCSLLQELCRTFQQERATYLAQLKDMQSLILLKEAHNKNEGLQMDNNQQLIGSVENPTEDSAVNRLFNDVNAKIKEITKEPKTEVKESNSVTEIIVSDSSKETQNSSASSKIENSTIISDAENIKIKTVNDESKTRLTEITPVKTEETLPTINSTDQENSSICDKEERVKVPVDVEVSTKSETAEMNSEPSSIEFLESKKEEHTNPLISNTPDLIESVTISEMSNTSNNQSSEPSITGIKDSSKVKISSTVTNGEVLSNSVTNSNKKQKDGRKKKK